MKSVTIGIEERNYPIVVSSNFEDFTLYLKKLDKKQRIVIITDNNVASHYLELLKTFIENKGYTVLNYIIDSGEEIKNLDTVKKIYTFLLDNKIERKNYLLAFGGGVVGDIVGFTAATYLRGVPFIQMPTTLLAQVDSSVGGKVGVNFLGVKNIIGAFYQPIMVLINPVFLKTLPIRHIRVGLAEIIVHCIIYDEELFRYMEEYLQDLFHNNGEVIEYIIAKNCSIKGIIVEKDEKETGIRAILNFGHTIGHAVEAASNFSLSHGEAVSIGIVGAFLLSKKLKIVKKGEMKRVVRMLKKIGLPTNYGNMNLNINIIYKKMLHDKKIENDTLVFILPVRIGEVKQVKVSKKELVLQVLEKLKSEIEFD